MMRSEFSVFYLDDGTLGENWEDEIQDVRTLKFKLKLLVSYLTDRRPNCSVWIKISLKESVSVAL